MASHWKSVSNKIGSDSNAANENTLYITYVESAPCTSARLLETASNPNEPPAIIAKIKPPKSKSATPFAVPKIMMPAVVITVATNQRLLGRSL